MGHITDMDMSDPDQTEINKRSDDLQSVADELDRLRVFRAAIAAEIPNLKHHIVSGRTIAVALIRVLAAFKASE